MPLLPLLLVLACTQTAGFGKPEPDDTGDSGGDDTQDTDPVDTADTDGDLDDDGFTPEEGDCDDADIRVSPGRPEDGGDGMDNDCDGKIDEEFTGVDVAYLNEEGSSEILTIDTIGRIADTVRLGSSCAPTALDHLGDGWVMVNGSSVSVADASGACEDVGDFSDTEVYEYGVYGVATGIDGTIYAATVTQLVSVDLDGTITELAAWTVDWEVPENHELAGVALAVDPVTGTVGIFDFTGGFATWNATDGLQILRRGDYVAPSLSTFAGAHRDGGGWYAPGQSGTTGVMGVYRFDEQAADWVLEEEWTVASWVPVMLGIDGGTGDSYVTANAGWYYTVWRVVDGTGYAADLYVTDGTVQHRSFQGIVVNDR